MKKLCYGGEGGQNIFKEIARLSKHIGGWKEPGAERITLPHHPLIDC